VEIPRLYHFFPEHNTQIHSDVPSSLDLKAYILAHELNRTQCSRLGQSIGLWIKKFHTWGAAPEQENLRQEMKGNTAMKELKIWLNYGGNVTAAIDRYPETLEPCREVFKEALNEVNKEEGTLVHGDFWSGKYVYCSVF
jgi:hypothetical protein